MESISLQQLRIVEDTLSQIIESIGNLEEWNASFTEARDFHLTPEGVKTLAADCMMTQNISKIISMRFFHLKNNVEPQKQIAYGDIAKTK